MESSKRRSIYFISLVFILKCFTKPFIITRIWLFNFLRIWNWWTNQRNVIQKYSTLKRLSKKSVCPKPPLLEGKFQILFISLQLWTNQCLLLRLSGFSYGYIYWDDEDDNNNNWSRGQLPDGSYDRNTKIYYCCRNDGYASRAIYLPTDTPFVLLKSGNHECQSVYGAREREEYFYWDSEDNSPQATATGSHPFLEFLGKRNLKVHYCYYY